MRALPALAVLLLVSACQAPPPEMTEAEIAQIEADVFGVYDLDLTESDDVGMVPGSTLSYELRDDRTFLLTLTRPDTTWTTTGPFSLWEPVDGCYPIEAAPYDHPDDKGLGTVCPGILTLVAPEGDRMIFRVRQ